MAFSNKFIAGCKCCDKCDVCTTTGSSGYCYCSYCDGGLAPAVFIVNKLTDAPFVPHSYEVASRHVNRYATAYFGAPTLKMSAYDAGDCIWNSTLDVGIYGSVLSLGGAHLVRLISSSAPSAIHVYYLELNLTAGTVVLKYLDAHVSGVPNGPDILAGIPLWKEVTASSDCKCSRKFKFDPALDYDAIFANVHEDYSVARQFCVAPRNGLCGCTHNPSGVIEDATKACSLCFKSIPVAIAAAGTPGCEFLGGTVNIFNNADGQYGSTNDGCRNYGEAVYGSYGGFGIGQITYKSLSARLRVAGSFSIYDPVIPPVSPAYLYYLQVASRTIRNACYALYGMPFEGICDLDDNPLSLGVGSLVASKCSSCAVGAIVEVTGGLFSLYYGGRSIESCVACNSVPGSVVLGAVTPRCGITNTDDRTLIPNDVLSLGFSVACPTITWPSGSNTDPLSLGIDRAFAVSSNYLWTSIAGLSTSSHTNPCNGIVYSAVPTSVARLYVALSPIAAPKCNYGVVAAMISVVKTYQVPSVVFPGQYDTIRIAANAIYTADGLDAGSPSGTDFTFCTITYHQPLIAYGSNYFGFGQLAYEPLAPYVPIADSQFPGTLTVVAGPSTTVTTNDGTLTHTNCGDWLKTYLISVPSIAYDGSHIDCGWGGCYGFSCTGSSTAMSLSLELKKGQQTYMTWGYYSSVRSCTLPCGLGIPTDLSGDTNPDVSASMSVDPSGTASLNISFKTVLCTIVPWYYGPGDRMSVGATYYCTNFDQATGGTFTFSSGNHPYQLCTDWPTTIAVTV